MLCILQNGEYDIFVGGKLAGHMRSDAKQAWWLGTEWKGGAPDTFTIRRVRSLQAIGAWKTALRQSPVEFGLGAILTERGALPYDFKQSLGNYGGVEHSSSEELQVDPGIVGIWLGANVAATKPTAALGAAYSNSNKRYEVYTPLAGLPLQSEVTVKQLKSTNDMAVIVSTYHKKAEGMNLNEGAGRLYAEQRFWKRVDFIGAL